MDVNELLVRGFVGLIGVYLSFSGAIAHYATDGLIRLGFEAPAPHIAAEAPRSVTPTTLPSNYERGGAIPHILLDNLEYQAAAVAGAGSSRERSDTKVAVEEAIVNILCSYRIGDELRTTTGSGVFIDSRGIILTNAHVAQFLLLGESRDDAHCVVRHGNPAQDAYHADLLYLSPLWVRANAAQIDAESPIGTGERDYALLFVTDAVSGPLPDRFPALTYDSTPLPEDEVGWHVTAAGYPAGSFRTKGPDAPLTPKSDGAHVTKIYTFGGGQTDLLSLSSSEVGEQGSSGGPILNEAGAIIGLIVTRGNSEDGEGSLRAITLPYINATIEEETGFDLKTTLEGNLERRSSIFKDALVPFLARILDEELVPQSTGQWQPAPL